MATQDVLIYNTTALTGAITLTSLASLTTANARQGTAIDFGATRSELWLAKLQTAPVAAVTAGTTIDLYMSWSMSSATLANTNYPGGCTGVDGAYAGPDAVVVNGLKQLEFVGSMIVCATVSTVLQIQHLGIVCARMRYGVPVVVNNTTQLLDGTAGDHILTFTPILPQIQAAV